MHLFYICYNSFLLFARETLVILTYLCYDEYRRKKEETMEQFLTDDDLLGLLEELDQDEAEIQELEFEMEMEASNRRYEEIIRKHRLS